MTAITNFSEKSVVYINDFPFFNSNNCHLIRAGTKSGRKLLLGRKQTFFRALTFNDAANLYPYMVHDFQKIKIRVGHLTVHELHHGNHFLFYPHRKCINSLDTVFQNNFSMRAII